MKTKRIVDVKLLLSTREKGCLSCGRKPCDAAHIRSRGAGGDDVFDNIIPLCRTHHVEQHKIGWVKFLKKYELESIFSAMGWTIQGLKLKKACN